MSIKKITSVLLAFVVFVTFLPATKALATSAEKEGQYGAALSELESFLQSPADASPEHLTGIMAAFETLDKYKYSEELRYYAYIMRNVIEDDYTDWYAEAYLNHLKKNERFDDYIHELSDTPLFGIDEMTAYYQGRKAEYAGNTDLAMQYYDSCPSFFDTTSRQVALTASKYAEIYELGEQLMEKKEYAKAYECFIRCGTYKDAQICAEYIVSILGYTPTSPTSTKESPMTRKVTEIPSMVTATPKPVGFTIYTKNGAMIRTAPNETATRLRTAGLNERYIAYGTVKSQTGGKDWYHIEYNGIDGYISTVMSGKNRQKKSTPSPTSTSTPNQTPNGIYINDDRTPTPTQTLDSIYIKMMIEYSNDRTSNEHPNTNHVEQMICILG